MKSRKIMLVALSTSSLLARGVNELLFPIGCALVVFIAEVLGRHVASAPADDRPPRGSFPKAA